MPSPSLAYRLAALDSGEGRNPGNFPPSISLDTGPTSVTVNVSHTFFMGTGLLLPLLTPFADRPVNH